MWRSEFRGPITECHSRLGIDASRRWFKFPFPRKKSSSSLCRVGTEKATGVLMWEPLLCLGSQIPLGSWKHILGEPKNCFLGSSLGRLRSFRVQHHVYHRSRSLPCWRQSSWETVPIEQSRIPGLCMVSADPGLLTHPSGGIWKCRVLLDRKKPRVQGSRRSLPSQASILSRAHFTVTYSFTALSSDSTLVAYGRTVSFIALHLPHLGKENHLFNEAVLLYKRNQARVINSDFLGPKHF